MNLGMYKSSDYSFVLILFWGEKLAGKMSPWIGNSNGKQGQRK